MPITQPTDELLLRYVRNQTSPDEKKLVDRWMQIESQASHIIDRLLKQENKTREKPRPDIDATQANYDSQTPSLLDSSAKAILAPPQQANEIGRLGDFRVLKILGEGGMGIVFLAEEAKLERMVALKTMKRELAANRSAKERFFREARAAAGLEHDHVVPIYHVGEENGTPYLAMPFLKGEPLDQRLARGGDEVVDIRAESQRQDSEAVPLPIAETLRIGREVAEGLAAAHDHGLVHRDIKPANIWLEERAKGQPPRVRILDFGLARVKTDDTQISNSGVVVGTPAYMSPEQARGKHVDHRADLFSLGVVLYQMSTGRRPFTGADTMALLSSLALDLPESPLTLNPAMPEALSDLVMSLLEKEAAKRPDSADVVVNELERIAAEMSLPMGAKGPDPFFGIDDSESAGPEPDALPEFTPKRAKPKNGRDRLISTGIAALTVLVAGAIIVLVVKKFESKSKKEAPGDSKQPAAVAPEQKPPKSRDDKSSFPPLDSDWARKVKTLSPQEQLNEISAELVKRNSGYAGKDDPTAFMATIKDGRIAELKINTVSVSDLTPVQALSSLEVLDCSRANADRGILADLMPLKGLSLKKLDVSNNNVRDLKPLQGMPLEDLGIADTMVGDLSVLKGLSLKRLYLGGSNVRNLTLLRGMPIEELSARSTDVDDLRPLKGMPLTRLYLDHMPALIDLTPLQSLPLVDLDLTGSAKVSSYDPICTMATLKRISLDDVKLTKENAIALLKLPDLQKINDRAARPLLLNVELWHSLPTVEPRATLQASTKRITDIVFGPDGSWLASTSATGAFRIWKVADRTMMFNVAVTRVPHQALCSPDGSWVVFSDSLTDIAKATDTTGALYFVDPKTGEMIGQPVPLGGNSTLALAPDGKALAVGMKTGKDKGLIRLFDPQERRWLKEFRSTQASVEFMHIIAKGKQILVNGEKQNQVLLLDSSSGEVQRTIDFAGPLHLNRYGAVPSADGRKFSAGYIRQSLWTIVDLDNPQMPMIDIPTGISGIWWSVWHPDGQRLFIGGNPHAGVIDVATGRIIARLADPAGDGVVFSPDGKTFALRNNSTGKISFYSMDDLPK